MLLLNHYSVIFLSLTFLHLFVAANDIIFPTSATVAHVGRPLTVALDWVPSSPVYFHLWEERPGYPFQSYMFGTEYDPLPARSLYTFNLPEELIGEEYDYNFEVWSGYNILAAGPIFSIRHEGESVGCTLERVQVDEAAYDDHAQFYRCFGQCDDVEDQQHVCGLTYNPNSKTFHCGCMSSQFLTQLTTDLSCSANLISGSLAGSVDDVAMCWGECTIGSDRIEGVCSTYATHRPVEGATNEAGCSCERGTNYNEKVSVAYFESIPGGLTPRGEEQYQASLDALSRATSTTNLFTIGHTDGSGISFNIDTGEVVPRDPPLESQYLKDFHICTVSGVEPGGGTFYPNANWTDRSDYPIGNETQYINATYSKVWTKSLRQYLIHLIENGTIANELSVALGAPVIVALTNIDAASIMSVSFLFHCLLLFAFALLF